MDARGKRAKRLLLAGIALACGLAMLAWSQPWFSIDVVEGVQLTEPAAARGDVAAPPLMALALAGIAALAGLALAGVILRWVLGSLVVVLGLIAITTCAVAIADPVRSISRLVTELTGVAGNTSTVELVDPANVASTMWPWVGVLAGALIAIAGAGVVATAKHWPTSARRFETRFADADSGVPVDSIDRWDALSGGDDPTTPADDEPGSPGGPGEPRGND